MWGLLKLTTSLMGIGTIFFGANSLPYKSGLALRDAGLYIKNSTPSISLPTITWPPVDVVGVYNQCLRLSEDDAGELFAKVILCEMLRPYAQESMLQTAIAHVAALRLEAAAAVAAGTATALEVQPVVIILVIPKPTACSDSPGTPTRPLPFTVNMLFGRAFGRAMGFVRRVLKPFVWCTKVASTCASKTCPAVAVPVLPDVDIPLFLFIFLIGFVSGKSTHLRRHLLVKCRRKVDETTARDNHLDQHDHLDPYTDEPNLPQQSEDTTPTQETRNNNTPNAPRTPTSTREHALLNTDMSNITTLLTKAMDDNAILTNRIATLEREKSRRWIANWFYR